MENNTLPQKITETINDIITELDAFKKNTSTPEYTLTGSVALYLFVYSLYANNEGATKAFVRKQLLSLPKPNDIDIVTKNPKDKANLVAYQNNKGDNLPFLSEVAGKKIMRKSESLYPIDLIIKPKPLFAQYTISIPYEGNPIEINIVHPQELLAKLYKSTTGYNSNANNFGEAHMNNNKRANKVKKASENAKKHAVLTAINTYGLMPVLEKPATKRVHRRSSSEGNESKPSGSFRSRLNFSRSPSKKGKFKLDRSHSKKGKLNIGSNSN